MERQKTSPENATWGEVVGYLNLFVNVGACQLFSWFILSKKKKIIILQYIFKGLVKVSHCGFSEWK